MVTINSKGLTLAELLLAASILVFVICGCLIFFVNCTFLNESNRNLISAMTHAQYVMEELRNESNLDSIKTMINGSGRLFTTFEELPNENITVCQWAPAGGWPSDPGGGEPPGCEGGVCPPDGGGGTGGDIGISPGGSIDFSAGGGSGTGEPTWECTCKTPPCNSCSCRSSTDSDPLGVCIRIDWRDRGVRDREVELLTAMTNYSLTPDTSENNGVEVSDEPEEGEEEPGSESTEGEVVPPEPPPGPPTGGDVIGGSCGGGLCQ